MRSSNQFNMGIRKHHLSVLKKLCKCDKKVQKTLLVEGGKPLQHCLRECAVNLLSGTVPLNKQQFKKLKRHRKLVRELSKRNTSHKKRIEIEQKGGFLASLLLPIIGSIAGAAIKTTIHKKRRK